MHDEQQDGVSRRRFLARTGAATGLVWAAPVVTGLSSRAFAQGSGAPDDCQNVFTADIAHAAQGTFAAPHVVAGLSLTTGNVDVLGDGYWASVVPPGYDQAIDLEGGGAATTELSTPVQGPGSYRLRVVVFGDGRNHDQNQVTVTFGAVYSESRTLAPADGPVTFEATVHTGLPASLTVTHHSATADSYGARLVAVSVDRCPDILV